MSVAAQGAVEILVDETAPPECDECGATFAPEECVLCERCADAETARILRRHAERGRLLGSLTPETVEALESIAEDIEAGR